MSAAAFSPGPFRRVSREPAGKRDAGGHLVLDAFGDSIGGLAYRTGDHLPEEQLANAQLFAASWELFHAVKLGRAALAADLAATLESHCVLDPETHEPDPATMDDVARPIVAELYRQIDLVDAAIAAAEGRS